MGIKEKLQAEMKAAMRARDKLRLETIRVALSAIQYEELQKQTGQLSEESVTGLLKTEIKKRREALEFAEKGQRAEMVQGLTREIAVLEEFLPQQLGEGDLEQQIRALKQDDPEIALGQVMKLLKERFPGQYDGKLASAVAKRIIGG